MSTLQNMTSGEMLGWLNANVAQYRIKVAKWGQNASTVVAKCGNIFFFLGGGNSGENYGQNWMNLPDTAPDTDRAREGRRVALLLSLSQSSLNFFRGEREIERQRGGTVGGGGGGQGENVLVDNQGFPVNRMVCRVRPIGMATHHHHHHRAICAWPSPTRKSHN